MKWLLALLILSWSFSLSASLGGAQLLAPSIELDIKGECGEFNVTVSAQNLGPGCYDVKIGVTQLSGNGEIYDPKEGWKSSVFYVDDSLCIEDGASSAMLMVRTGNPHDPAEIRASIRNESRSWSSEAYTLQEDCPVPQSPVEYIILAALVVIIFILVGIALYVKKFK